MKHKLAVAVNGTRGAAECSMHNNGGSLCLPTLNANRFAVERLRVES